MRVRLASGLLLCVAALLTLAPLPVLAADPPPSGAAPSATATPAAAEPAGTPSTAQDASAGLNPSTDASTEESAPQDASSGKNAGKNTAKNASAPRDAPAGHAASDRPQHGVPRSAGQQESAARPPLDLTAPPASHLMTPEQVQALIGEPDDQEPEEVMVEEGRYEAPVPQGQIPALAWALLHPLQAWRIFTPVTDQ